MDKVLIADDNAGMRKMLCQALDDEGRSLILAADGLAALDMARSELPDLVILDMRMPGKDGSQVCAALRADERTRAIPVLMLSGLDDESGAELGLAAGADDFLAKPFNMRELGARVSALLGRAA